MADDTSTPSETPDGVTEGGEASADAPAAAPAKKAAKKAPAKRAAAKRTTKKAAAAPSAETPADAPTEAPADAPEGEAPVKKAAAKKAAKKAPAKRAAKKAAAPSVESPDNPDSAASTASTSPVEPAQPAEPATAEAGAPMVLFKAPETKVTTRTRGRRAAVKVVEATPEPEPTLPVDEDAEEQAEEQVAPEVVEPRKRTPRKRASKKAAVAPEQDEESETGAVTATADDAETAAEPAAQPSEADGDSDNDGDSDSDDDGSEGGPRRRRRRGGRRRRKAGDGDDNGTSDDSQDDGDDSAPAATKGSGSGRGGRGAAQETESDDSGEGGTRRRRRRRREGDEGGNGGDDANTVTRVRKPRSAEDEITAIAGSTRLEAKKQRRREGREAGRRRAPIVSEAEFLARRESVDRVMVIRQREELTQIGVLEDKVLVEHYVARESQTSLIGNVYLGRVQNVLPSMEAAFIDIGKGRNAVLYAGEVNWASLGHREGQPRKIESVLSSGQSILVQVTKDPIGHKGARLTSQVSLAGRFLVYVPDGTTSGISRKLPDTERNRLKTLLKEIVPDTAGVIVRTAAEGASEEELTRDVERLKARWEDIEGKAKGQAPQLLYGEPDLTLKVVRDLFTEDFKKLVIQGEDAWSSVQDYVSHIAPDLTDRVERYDTNDGPDVFATYRIDEQIAKGLDRKVWLPSGGSLVIDRTEAMTVVDVNTGKFTGSGGNLEETVTKNNLEAAEEIVRQLRLRDIGGIIVVDFIDMVLESNRDLVLRRMVECLGRDRTRHQVAEVTSLGLVQMTRKRIGTGLLEAFSENCEHCQGRGLVLHDQPVEPRRGEDSSRGGGNGGNGGGNGGGSGNGAGGRRTRGGRGRGSDDQAPVAPKAAPSPKDVAAMAKPENAARIEAEADTDADTVVETDIVTDAPAPVETAPEPATEPEVEVPAEPEPAAPAEAPAVVTRTRRKSRSSEAISTTPAPVETAPEVDVPAEPEPAVEAPAEPEPEPEPQPAAPAETPAVVTRTRRTTRSTETISTTPAPMPVVEPVAVAAAPVEPAPAAEPPKVVTRTRGRNRSAQPAPVDTSDAAASGEPGDIDGDAGSSIEHVPVKKRTRKR